MTNLFGNLDWNMITGSTPAKPSTGGFDINNLTAEGINAALKGIPFIGGIMQFVIGKLNIVANVSNVLKYGFTSWGASTTPEKTKAEFAENAYPHFMDTMKGLTPENMGSSLSQLYKELYVSRDLYRKLRQFHSKAKSTQLAMDWAVAEYTSLIKGLEDTVASLKANKVIITTSNYTADAGSLNINSLNEPNRPILSGDVIEKPQRLKTFVVDAASVRNLGVDSTLNTDNNGNGIVDDGINNQVFEKVTSGKLLTYAAMAFGAFKMFK